MDFDVIIEYFLSGMTPLDQEDDMLIIETICTTLKNLSSFESRDLNIDCYFDKQLVVFSQIDYQSC